ncbi:MAG: hypothetical protein K8L91_20150 [Anaerolineae bacterium]|nr:hypothetical protein [Anaerolineae bacterium]
MRQGYSIPAPNSLTPSYIRTRPAVRADKPITAAPIATSAATCLESSTVHNFISGEQNRIWTDPESPETQNASRL